MILTKHQTREGVCWAVDGRFLPETFDLKQFLSLKKQDAFALLEWLFEGNPVVDQPLVAPIDPEQEVWACGVTYLRSREARMEESDVADVYERVYDAERPEIFFKSLGWRTIGCGQSIRVRDDSMWNVPEPELTLVVNSAGEIVGYTAGNDVSSRSIEGENPLYLPQAKTYDGSCSIGSGIVLIDDTDIESLPIKLNIERENQNVFAGDANTNQMKRKPAELVDWLMREINFPHGVFLMTGTCLVPGDEFSLQSGDKVQISVGEMTLLNSVA